MTISYRKQGEKRNSEVCLIFKALYFYRYCETEPFLQSLKVFEYNKGVFEPLKKMRK